VDFGHAKISDAIFSGQSLLLSTTVFNDTFITSREIATCTHAYNCQRASDIKKVLKMNMWKILRVHTIVQQIVDIVIKCSVSNFLYYINNTSTFSSIFKCLPVHIYSTL